MKFSLRNLALAGAICLVGGAMAQDLTVTKNWSVDLSVADYGSGTKNEVRFGTGVNGKVYFVNKNSKIVYAVDANGAKQFATLDACGTCISADDAGNLLVSKTFNSVNDPLAWNLIKPDGTVSSVDVVMPDETVTNGRTDQLGRIVGDITSEDGAYGFLVMNGNTHIVLLQFVNGQQVTDVLDDYVSQEVEGVTLGTSTIAQPEYTFAEMQAMESDCLNTFAARMRTAKNVFYWNADGDFVKMPAPSNANSQEGFDVFILGDKFYQVVPTNTSGSNYDSSFAICDAEGNIIYQADPQGETLGNGAQNFGSFAARKVSDNKVELYRYFDSDAGLRCSMYTIEIPANDPDPLYLAGNFQNWAPENAAEFTYGENGYTYTFADGTAPEFKISTMKGDWSVFNAGVLSLADDNTTYTLEAGKTVDFIAGKIGNLAVPSEGNWTITVSADLKSITLTGESTAKPFEAPEVFYLMGSYNNWNGATALQLKKVSSDDNVTTYEVEAGNLAAGAQLKVASTSNWSGYDYGRRYDDGKAMVAGTTYQGWYNCDNFILAEAIENAKVIFTMQNKDDYKTNEVTLTIESVTPPAPVYSEKGVFAYDLLSTKGENMQYNVTFKATGDAADAVLVLTNTANPADQTTIDLGAVVDGENSFTVDATKLPDNVSYNWAVELHGYEIQENKVTPVETLITGINSSRAGVVAFTDPQLPTFGYTVVARPKNGGFDVYNPAGELVNSKLFANNAAMGGTGANYSSPMRGVQRGNEAVFASWGDAAYGVVAFDVATLAEPYSVFEGTKASSGLITNNGVNVGSGTPCVEFWGKGDETLMFTFDEDVFGNSLAVSKIGAAKTVGTALENWGLASNLANTNVGMCSTEGGLFLTQTRGPGNVTGGVPGVSYLKMSEQIGAETHSLDWTIGDLEGNPVPSDEMADFLPSTSGGIDINPAGDLIALGTYTGVEVYILGWTEDQLPTLEKYATVNLGYSTNINYSTLRFDAANNLHVISQVGQKPSDTMYAFVTLAEKEPVVTTDAKTDMLIANTTGVESIQVGAENEGNAVFYNLNGVRVNSNNLTPGVYVKSVNGKATKVVVK